MPPRSAPESPIPTVTATANPDDTIAIEVTARDWPDHKTARSARVDLAAPVVLDSSPRGQLVEKIRRIAQRRGSYRLADGTTRVNYFDKYRLAHSPALLREIAGQMVPLLPAGTEAVAGLEMGGIPLATMISQLTGCPLLMLRKQPRDLGTTAPAEGGDLAGRRVVPLADVVTTGAQFATSIRALRAAGAIVTHALCVIDQQNGAPARLQKENVALTSLFTAFELLA